MEREEDKIADNIEKAVRLINEGVEKASFITKTPGELLIALSCIVESFIESCAKAMSVDKECVREDFFAVIERYEENEDDNAGTRMKVSINPEFKEDK